MIRFQVDGKMTPLSSTWVHLQVVAEAAASHYAIAVPWKHCGAVFDPEGESRKPPDQFLPDFIRNRIEEFGTFIFEGYLDNMRAIVDSRPLRYQWVVATVRSVDAVSDGIEIRGLAVPFDGSSRS